MRERLYQVLEEMVESASNGDKENVLELDRRYGSLVPHITSLDPRYDDCRAFCLASATAYEGRLESAISEAKEIFSQIPRP